MDTKLDSFKKAALTAGKDAKIVSANVQYDADELHALRDVLWAGLDCGEKEAATTWLTTGGREWQTLIQFLNGGSVYLQPGEDWEMSKPTGVEPAGPSCGRTTLEAFKNAALALGGSAKQRDGETNWGYDAAELKTARLLYGGLSREDKDEAINWLATGGNAYLAMINFLKGGRVWLMPGQQWE